LFKTGLSIYQTIGIVSRFSESTITYYFTFALMLKSLIKYWNKPTVFIECKATRFLMSFLFGLFVFLFLYIFQPYGISNYPESVLIKCLGYGLVTFVIMLVNSFLLPLLLPKMFNPNTFKVKNNVFISLWFLLSIAIGNWYFTSVFFASENTDSLLKFVGITMSVGVFPILLGSYYMERTLNSANQKTADEANTQLQSMEQGHSQSHYRFQSENKSEQFEIAINELICIKADGNYCEFYCEQQGEIKKYLIRMTLKSVEEKLQNEEDILRCHRSYLINIRKVKHLTSSARNISLHFDNVEFTVPVSRLHKDLVTKTIRHIS